MDNNDMFSKLTQMLDNPQAADIIKQIASSFASSNTEEKEESVPVSATAGKRPDFDLDKIKNVMNKSDKNVTLLRAITPYMSKTRAGKIESAVKALQIINMLSYLQ